MITKYRVNGDNIELYQNDDMIQLIPNTEANLDVPKLYNNLIFVTKDINYASRRENVYKVRLRSSALFSLLFGVLSCINLNSFNSVVFFMLLFNLFKFITNKSKYNESRKRLDYYKDIEKGIKESLSSLLMNPSGEKSDNLSLEYTTDQIVMDHQEWVNKIGDFYSYNDDVDTIQNSKILIK